VFHWYDDDDVEDDFLQMDDEYSRKLELDSVETLSVFPVVWL